MATPTARITLELLAGGEPIQGLIEEADGSRRPFWGWLELIENLQRASTGQTSSAGRGHVPPEVPTQEES